MERYLKALAAAGVDVTIYNPMKIWNPWSILGRNHDKILAVDQELALTGGRNMASNNFISPEQSSAQDPSNEDMDMVYRSREDAKAMIEAFYYEKNARRNKKVINDLNAAQVQEVQRELGAARLAMENSPAITSSRFTINNLFSGRHYYPTEILHNDSWLHKPKRNQIAEKLVEAIANAKNEIIIQNAYVMLSQGMLNALREAAERGVKIILHTNSTTSSSSHRIPQMFFESDWRLLAQTVPNIEIHTTGAQINHLHTKAMVVDETYLFIGTYNMDSLSQNINAEIGAVVKSQSVAKQVAERIKKAIEDTGVRYTLDGKTNIDGSTRKCAYLQGIADYTIRPILMRILRPFA
jgi:putative cardiolipin synthase